MILHLSIPAAYPEATGKVIATLLGGEAFPFHAFPDAWIVVTGDKFGTAVEIVPETTVMENAGEAVAPGYNNTPPTRWPVHFAAQTALAASEVHGLCSNAGWLSRDCDRGVFRLVEVWVENRFLLELFPPEWQDAYDAAMTLENWRRWT